MLFSIRTHATLLLLYVTLACLAHFAQQQIADRGLLRILLPGVAEEQIQWLHNTSLLDLLMQQPSLLRRVQQLVSSGATRQAVQDMVYLLSHEATLADCEAVLQRSPRKLAFVLQERGLLLHALPKTVQATLLGRQLAFKLQQESLQHKYVQLSRGHSISALNSQSLLPLPGGALARVLDFDDEKSSSYANSRAVSGTVTPLLTDMSVQHSRQHSLASSSRRSSMTLAQLNARAAAASHLPPAESRRSRSRKQSSRSQSITHYVNSLLSVYYETLFTQAWQSAINTCLSAVRQQYDAVVSERMARFAPFAIGVAALHILSQRSATRDWASMQRLMRHASHAAMGVGAIAAAYQCHAQLTDVRQRVLQAQREWDQDVDEQRLVQQQRQIEGTEDAEDSASEPVPDKLSRVQLLKLHALFTMARVRAEPSFAVSSFALAAWLVYLSRRPAAAAAQRLHRSLSRSV